MPLTPPPPSLKKETATASVDRTALEEFRNKAILYGLGALGGAIAWLALGRTVPVHIALPLVGGAAVEAFRNIQRWRAWHEAHPTARVHPDRVREIQQETVRIMSDAVKARAWVTHTIIACVTVPTLLEIYAGLERSVAVASVDPVAIRAGDWWRLLGGTYLHGSLYHYLGNMSALLVYGSILEFKTSRLRLPLVYLASCVAGSIASLQVPPDIPSIGASGGVVGVIAYLFLFSRRQAVRFPPAFHGATVSVFIGLITAGALGFWYIDNPGHAGGAIAGLFIAGLTVDTARSYEREIEQPLFDLFGWMALAIILGGSAVTSARLLGY